MKASFLLNTDSQYVIELDVSALEETKVLGRMLASILAGGEFIGLRGQLGAGKTEFVRAVCAGLGLSDVVASPTFVFEHIYERNAVASAAEVYSGGITEIHHWDLYRMYYEAERNDLYDYIGNTKCVVFIEWPEKVAWVHEILSLSIEITRREDSEESRHFRIVSCDETGKRFVQSLRSSLNL